MDGLKKVSWFLEVTLLPIKIASDDSISHYSNKIMNVANKCENYRIKKMFVSVLTINNRLHSDLINTVKNALKLDCVKYGYNFIENSNIPLDNYWEDGLHSNNSGKSKLLNE